jgi:hypothetical protein
MRFVFVFIAGIATGYALQSKKDETIDSVAGGVADFFEHRVAKTVRSYIPAN